MRLSLILCVLLLTPSAWAAEWSVKATVQEPVGQDDLASIKFYISRANGSEWVPSILVPATSVDGGGTVEVVITGTTTDGEKEIGEVRATAIDTSGNESTPAIAALLVDKQPPNAPTNLTITTTSK